LTSPFEVIVQMWLAHFLGPLHLWYNTDASVKYNNNHQLVAILGPTLSSPNSNDALVIPQVLVMIK